MNLILLIGTNPLPNYVVAKYFLQLNEVNRIFYMHSVLNENVPNQASTKEYADSIDEQLKAEFKNVKSEYIALKDVSNPATITSDLQEQLSDKLYDALVHLNYTGGTKAMAVHIYDYVKNKISETHKYETSYLDSKSFKLIVEGIPTEDLRSEVNISLEKLLKIHRYNFLNSSRGIPLLPVSYDDATHVHEVINALEVCISSNTIMIFKNLWQSNMRPVYFDKYNHKLNGDERNISLMETKAKAEDYKYRLSTIESRKQFEDFKIGMKDNESLSALFNKIIGFNSIFNADGFLMPADNLEISSFQSFVKFLDGEWLELFIHKKLLRTLNNKMPSGTDIKAKKLSSQKELQLDGYVLRGYQLFAISCTTDFDRYVKSKGFEVIHRASQIGGDEAKSILICFNQKPKDIKDDLISITGKNEEHFAVFGINDLDDIENKLKAFILN